MTGACEFSPDRKYRYALWRRWDMQHDLVAGVGSDYGRHKNAFLVVIGLNPSTADETKDDLTIRRCIDFAMRWGYPALCMLNLFAYRSTDAEAMKRYPFPIGQENNAHLQNICRQAVAYDADILCAWGKHGWHGDRVHDVALILGSGIAAHLKCLGQNKDGSPVHPLYVPADTMPKPFDIAAVAQANILHGRKSKKERRLVPKKRSGEAQASEC